MTRDKKDLTRIEDLGEFLHELDETENYLELPALPTEVEEENLLETPDLPELPAEEPSLAESLTFEQEPEELAVEEEVDAEPLFVDGFSDDSENEVALDLGDNSPAEETAPFTLSEQETVEEEPDEEPFSGYGEPTSTPEPEEDPTPTPAAERRLCRDPQLR